AMGAGPVMRFPAQGQLRHTARPDLKPRAMPSMPTPVTSVEPPLGTGPGERVAVQASLHRPGFLDALRYWVLLGWISFGGPAGQIAIMHADLVAKRRWVDEASFLRGLNFCMLLPGPEAMQLATWLGWRLHGMRGGIAAGVMVVLPGG